MRVHVRAMQRQHRPYLIHGEVKQSSISTCAGGQVQIFDARLVLIMLLIFSIALWSSALVLCVQIMLHL